MRKNIVGILALMLLIALTFSGCMETSDQGYESDNEEELTGTATYSGTWSGSSQQMGAINGTWEYVVDFDQGTVTGSFDGDAAGDITGSVSNGIIEASGEAAFGSVEWSGSFSSDGSQVSGDWEFVVGDGSGTWSGSIAEETNDETKDEGTNGDEEEEELTESDITSVDVTISGFEGGQLEGDIRVRARELTANTPDLRIESENAGGIVIYNNDEELGYLYSSSDDKWTQFSGTYAKQIAQTYAQMAVSAREWTVTYGIGNTNTISYGEKTLQITVNEVNPSLSDDLFTPPEGAEVEEVAIP